MTTRFAALCALAVLALSACAPLAVGGEWSSAAPVQRDGWTITTSSLRFDPSGSVRIEVTAVPTALGTCGRNAGAMNAQWFVNAAGQTVVHDGICDSPTVMCAEGTVQPCTAAGALALVYNERSGALVSVDGRVVLTRAAR